MMLNITGRCPVCGSITHISCKKTAWRAYEAGALAQEAFADMDIVTRETIISGMCAPCQASFFEVDEEDDCDGICDLCSLQDECMGSDIL